MFDTSDSSGITRPICERTVALIECSSPCRRCWTTALTSLAVSLLAGRGADQIRSDQIRSDLMSVLGIGISTSVGIGGDPINGSSFLNIIKLFNDDDETGLAVIHLSACHRTHQPDLSRYTAVTKMYLNSSSSMCNLVFCQDTVGLHHAARRYPSVSRQLFNTDIRRRIAWELTRKS